MACVTPTPAISTNATPLQMALNYVYDRNGNKVGGGERGTFEWPLPSFTDETAQFSAAGRLQNRQIYNGSAISNQNASIVYNYDAGGNMTNAVGNGQRWTFTYDEDNRATSIDWDSGISSKHITNHYDALGRRFSKTVDGVTTGYVLSLAGGMERVLCDLDGSGNITAYYVHGADLCYRVDATNGLTCYHGDAMGNVLALTDGRTNLVAQYAYTPYGRSLSSTNLPVVIANQYSFVGSQGVMEDLPGTFFMRARYYSSETGVFLSADPIRKIGPNWKPIFYTYADTNPNTHSDPSGMQADVGFGDVYGVAEHVHEIWTGQARGWKVIEYGLEDGFQIGVSLAVAAYGTPAMIATVDAVGTASTVAQVSSDTYQGLHSRSGFLYDLGKSVTDAYMNGINTSGNALGSVLYYGFGVGAVSGTTMPSTTAGTTPMARFPSLPLNSSPFPALQLNGSQSHTTGAVLANNVANASSAGATTGASPTRSSGGSNSYTVRSGDTLGDIAYANHTTVSSIANASGIQNVNIIYPGQIITIPGGHH